MCVCLLEAASNSLVSQLSGGVVPHAEDRLRHGRGRAPIPRLRPRQLQNADTDAGHHRVGNPFRYRFPAPTPLQSND